MYVQKIAAHVLLSAALMFSTASHAMSGREKAIVAGCLVATGIVIGVGILVAMRITLEKIHRNNVIVDKSKLRQLKIERNGYRKLKQSFQADGYNSLESTSLVTSNSGGIVGTKYMNVESWVEQASKILEKQPIDITPFSVNRRVNK
jgi:hypothetical protein